MLDSDLHSTAAALLETGKGILAADESLATIGKRFTALGIAATEENRRAYRELLITTPGLDAFVSGVILFDETLRQTIDGGPAAETLVRLGLIPGVKVDLGTIALAGFPEEKITQGLDGLRERLAEYRRLGARFTKWRAVLGIGDGRPTATALAANAEVLARFAALSQEAGLVPIVEPEILVQGTHDLARTEATLAETLRVVFAALAAHQVLLEGLLLKTGMVLPGETYLPVPDVHAIAEATRRCLRRVVPAAVPGVVFLSGGQSDSLATERLNALCEGEAMPWTLSFSFGRALQDEALRTWAGTQAQVAAAQAALYRRAESNHLALLGRYRAGPERD